VDVIDRKIVQELQADARLTRSELGRRVGLSSTAVADRLRRLEETKVIVGYHASIDPKKVGYGISAMLRIRPNTGDLKRIAGVAQETPEVIECHRITGEDCYIMTIMVPSIDELEQVIDRFTSHGQTTTSIIHSSPVPRRAFAPIEM